MGYCMIYVTYDNRYMFIVRKSMMFNGQLRHKGTMIDLRGILKIQSSLLSENYLANGRWVKV